MNAGEVGSQILNARQGLALTIDTRRLQSEERLIVPQVLREETVAEDVAAVSRHAEDGSARAVRLQRHDRPLLARERLRGTEELEDVVFAQPQVLPHLWGQCTCRRIATQLIAIRPDLHVAAPELRQKRRDAHTAISSRSPAAPGRGMAAHASASIASASFATVGCSKRFRSGRSTPKVSRTRDTS